jgi:Tfp pilus assembly protein PilF
MRKAVRIYAAYGDAHRAMAECYAKMNDLELAVQEFKKALEQPHEADVHLQLGKIYGKQNNEALAMYQLELFVEEARPGSSRDRAVEILSRRRLR